MQVLGRTAEFWDEPAVLWPEHLTAQLVRHGRRNTSGRRRTCNQILVVEGLQEIQETSSTDLASRVSYFAAASSFMSFLALSSSFRGQLVQGTVRAPAP